MLGAAALSGAAARLTRQYAVAAVAGSGAILLLHSSFYLHYTSDDAYISYRYARNLSDGLGLVWNPGEHVEGYSNFLWVEILAGLHRFGADIVLSGRWLGFALAVVAAGGTYLLARDPSRAPPGRVAGLVAALLLASSGTWALWGVCRPRTAALRDAHPRRRAAARARTRSRAFAPASGAVWALVAMTRPDGIVLVAVSGAFKIGEAVARSRATGTLRPIARELATLALWLAGFAIVFAPYFAWRYTTYGWLFPTPTTPKVGSGLDQYDRGLPPRVVPRRVRRLAAAPRAARHHDDPVRRAPAIYVRAARRLDGVRRLRRRRLAPPLPLLRAPDAAVLRARCRVRRRAGCVGPRRARAVASAAAGHGRIRRSRGGHLHAAPSAADSNRIVGERRAVDDRGEVGRWLHTNVSETRPSPPCPSAPSATNPASSSICSASTTSTSPTAMSILGDFPAGHEKYDSEYVLDRRPDIIILSDGLSASPWTSADYATLKASIIPAVADMLGNERLLVSTRRRTVQVREGKG